MKAREIIEAESPKEFLRRMPPPPKKFGFDVGEHVWYFPPWDQEPFVAKIIDIDERDDEKIYILDNGHWGYRRHLSLTPEHDWDIEGGV